MAGNTVLISLEAPGGQLCVDIFRRPAGTFGFESFRRDPEDGRGWFPVGGTAELVFETAIDAVQAAERAVPWLSDLCHDDLSQFAMECIVSTRE